MVKALYEYLPKLQDGCLLTLQGTNTADHFGPSTARGKTGGCAGGSKLPLLNLIVAGAN